MLVDVLCILYDNLLADLGLVLGPSGPDRMPEHQLIRDASGRGQALLSNHLMDSLHVTTLVYGVLEVQAPVVDVFVGLLEFGHQFEFGVAPFIHPHE